MIRFRFDPAEGLADRLQRVAVQARFVSAATQATNDVATRADLSLRRGEIRDINLTPAYVKSKTDLRLAPVQGPARAEIVTAGDPTVMGRFAPLLTLPGRGALRRAGPRAGNRNAGVALAIRKSSPTFEPQWFVLPLKRGNVDGGNGLGVFVRDDRLRPSPKATREGKAGKRHIYGPSPYVLFKAQIRAQSGEILDDLERTARARVADLIESAL